MRALGIDVGVRKGLDLVLVETPRTVVEVSSHVTPAELASHIGHLKPDTIALDSPPAFGHGGPRKTEQALRKRGISLYATPWDEGKKIRPFYNWMREGFKVFHACATAGFPLFSDHGYLGSAMEVFPYASSVALGGALRPKGVRKKAWRTSVLKSQGIDTSFLKTVDSIDAALAALTGLFALEDCVCWLGEPSEGVIILPCRKADLKERYTS